MNATGAMARAFSRPRSAAQVLVSRCRPTCADRMYECEDYPYSARSHSTSYTTSPFNPHSTLSAADCIMSRVRSGYRGGHLLDDKKSPLFVDAQRNKHKQDIRSCTSSVGHLTSQIILSYVYLLSTCLQRIRVREMTSAWPDESWHDPSDGMNMSESSS